MKFIKIILVSVLVIISFVVTYSQVISNDDFFQKYFTNQWTTEDGHTSSTLLTIIQSDDGYM